ncbi:MAG: hypothetical protein HFJ41_02910 [Clostridia bacterium]|nr:hypothetical protein [Clostridia bacterium]
MKMKFVKGMLIGGAATIGAVMMYKEMSGRNKRHMVKKGKQFAKKLGIL